MARLIALAAILAATTAAAACGVGEPPVGPLVAAAGTTVAPAPTPATSGPAAPSGDPDTTSGNVINIPGLPSGLPDLSGIAIGGISVDGTPVRGSLPAGFPLPPGATTVGVFAADGNIAAELRVPDPTSAYHFWLAALPRAGYAVGARGFASIGGVVHAGIAFGGHGYQPAGVTIVGATVTVGLVGGGGKTPPPVVSNGTIVVQRSAAHLTLTCAAGAEVNILGSADDITLVGDCGTLDIAGSDDLVVADHATVVNMTGANLNVTVHRGNPQVNRVGANEEFHLG